jgi:hypothetical protein
MNFGENTKYILGTLSILVIALAYTAYSYSEEIMGLFTPEVRKEVHVHSDFLFYINAMKVDLTADRYQSSTSSVKHKSFHFHDNIDTMLHRHADGLTLGDFMSSIGITLTQDCITLDTGEQYCTDDTNTLRMFVNGEVVEDPANYITKEEDRILLYYGNSNSTDVQTLITQVSDLSCVYSGTCPERGKPPAESCGITCEI